jgi:hypothetical protein
VTRIDWRGTYVLESVRRATQAAVDDTTKDAAAVAKASHWWAARTGDLTGQIVNEPARRFGPKIRGRFGSTKTRGFYGLFLERRTPFLRPASDIVFRTLAGRIRRRLF